MLPKKLLIRYAIDWILILVVIAFSGTLSFIKPNHRPFSPYDPAISYPYVTLEKIPTGALICLAIILPAVIIACFCMLVPASSSAFRDHQDRRAVFKQRLINLNRAWMGLGMSIALAMFITNGIKNIVGKPRPDLVSRCNVKWDVVDSIVNSTRGNAHSWDILVNSVDVCRSFTDNKKRLNEGFRSFPSGHSSMSFAGLGFLAIFLYTSFILTTSFSSPISATTSHHHDTTSLYPPQSLPIFFFIFLSCPFFVATYIATSRFSDFRHAGFDILAGVTIGICVALLSSWWYALPAAGGVGRGRTRAGYNLHNQGALVDGLTFRKPSDPEEGPSRERLQ